MINEEYPRLFTNSVNLRKKLPSFVDDTRYPRRGQLDGFNFVTKPDKKAFFPYYCTRIKKVLKITKIN